MENKKNFFLISGILLTIIIVVVLWVSRSKISSLFSAKKSVQETGLSYQNNVETIIVTTTLPSPELDAFQVQVTVAAKNDQDLDGLNDAEEASYKTNPSLSDTDADGLLDKDEIMVFHTNPLNPDTDKDGHTDGDEVRRGYDPSGPGKLIVP